MNNMHDALNDFLKPDGLETTLYPPTSRYHGLPVKTLQRSDGSEVAYLSRRFIPSPDQFDTLQEYSITLGDRIDNVAAQFLGDPERFWVLADANSTTLDPQQLTAEVGRRLRIPLPEGIPGAANA